MTSLATIGRRSTPPIRSMTPKVSGLVPESVLLWRVAASAEALDRLAKEFDRRVLRLADDEALGARSPAVRIDRPARDRG